MVSLKSTSVSQLPAVAGSQTCTLAGLPAVGGKLPPGSEKGVKAAMKIQRQDLFHGAALMQVVEHPSFKALNKAPDGKYGHYILNNDTRLFVKYTTGAGPEYFFTLSADDVSSIRDDETGGHRVFLVMVCGEDTVCAVPSPDLWVLADKNTQASQQVWVRSYPGKSMRFGRGGHELVHTIPHSGFPAVVLD